MTHAFEDWSTIHDTAYRVSSLGRVASPQGKILTPFVGDKAGHLRVTIDGKHEYVHRLVAQAFLGPESGEVCHNDNDPTNNDAGNLRWDTRSANVLDLRAVRTECPNGHEYSTGNTYIVPSTGWRRCRECKRAARAA